MKKFLILFLLIQASIICSSKKYLYEKIAPTLDSIDGDGNIPENIYQAVYDGNMYSMSGKNGTFVDREEIQTAFKNFFELGKSYMHQKLNALKAELDTMTQKNNSSITELNKVNNQSLIQFLNNYSTPAKIGFGIAGIVVVASLVYSSIKVYDFGKQKYSDWKAKKEESES